jgi:hypothetical protein
MDVLVRGEQTIISAMPPQTKSNISMSQIQILDLTVPLSFKLKLLKKSKDTRILMQSLVVSLYSHLIGMEIVTRMARALLCPVKGHAWTTAGLCERCEKPCYHAVTVFDPQTGIEKCLDCGFLRARSRKDRETKSVTA